MSASTAIVTVPLAHTGHWLESIVYLVPIAGFALWLGITTFRDRRSRRDGDHPDTGAGT